MIAYRRGIPFCYVMMEDLISKAEIECERSPDEFVRWFDTFLEKTRDDRRWREPILLHQGIAKQIYEEVFPLFRLLEHKRTEWKAHRFRNVLGNQAHDVVVTPALLGGISHFEITVADRDHSEALRMEHFVKYGSVSAIGPLTWTGSRKNDRVLEISEDMQPCTDLLNQKKEQLTAAIQRKCQFCYANGTALIVYFDDRIAFAGLDDQPEMRSILDATRESWRGRFSALYIVGVSGLRLWEG